MNQSFTITKNTTPEKTAHVMRNLIRSLDDCPITDTAAADVARVCASTNWSLPYSLAYYAFKAAYFEPDTDTQTIRTPRRVLTDKKANCVDYTVFICAVARRFLRPDKVKFEIVDLDGTGYTHVRPIIDGRPVDVVPGQEQSGNEKSARKPKTFPTLHEIAARRTKLFAT